MSVAGLFTAYRKARKDYICDNCHLPIHRGEYYDYEQAWGREPCRYHPDGGLGGDKSVCEKLKKETK